MLSLSHDSNDTVSNNSIGKDIVSESTTKRAVSLSGQTNFSQTGSGELDYHAYETVFSIEPEMVQHTKTPAIPTEYTWDAAVKLITKPLDKPLFFNQLVLLILVPFFLLQMTVGLSIFGDLVVLTLATGYYLLRLAYTLLKNPLVRMRAKSFYATAIGNDIPAMEKLLAIAFSVTN